MRDEDVGELDSLPQVLPDFFLRGTGAFDKVAADLNVGAVDDGNTRTILFDQGDESRHLRIVDDHDVGAARGKGPSFREPVSIGIVGDPVIHLHLTFLRQANRRICDTCKLAHVARAPVP